VAKSTPQQNGGVVNLQKSGYVPVLIAASQVAIKHAKDVANGRTPNLAEELIEWYLRTEFNGVQLKMLQDAYDSKRLVVLLDGLDEAPELADDIQSFILCKLVPECIRFVVTGRPEVTARFAHAGFTILGLKGYTDEHQRKLLAGHLEGEYDVFMSNLLTHTGTLHHQDDLFADFRYVCLLSLSLLGTGFGSTGLVAEPVCCWHHRITQITHIVHLGQISASTGR
jgi:hypothetical protein